MMSANPVNQLEKGRAGFLNALGLGKRLYRSFQRGDEAAELREETLGDKLNVLLRDRIGQKELKYRLLGVGAALTLYEALSQPFSMILIL
jgi:hypothetical protein